MRNILFFLVFLLVASFSFAQPKVVIEKKPTQIQRVGDYIRFITPEIIDSTVCYPPNPKCNYLNRFERLKYDEYFLTKEAKKASNDTLLLAYLLKKEFFVLKSKNADYEQRYFKESFCEYQKRLYLDHKNKKIYLQEIKTEDTVRFSFIFIGMILVNIFFQLRFLYAVVFSKFNAWFVGLIFLTSFISMALLFFGFLSSNSLWLFIYFFIVVILIFIDWEQSPYPAIKKQFKLTVIFWIFFSVTFILSVYLYSFLVGVVYLILFFFILWILWDKVFNPIIEKKRFIQVG